MARRGRRLPGMAGNPILGRLARIDVRLDDHETRITAVERELTETNADVALLADVVLRARRRARARMTSELRLQRRRRDRHL